MLVDRLDILHGLLSYEHFVFWMAGDVGFDERTKRNNAIEMFFCKFQTGACQATAESFPLILGRRFSMNEDHIIISYLVFKKCQTIPQLYFKTIRGWIMKNIQPGFIFRVIHAASKRMIRQ